MSIIVLSLANNQLAHIKNCKRPAEACKILCNIHKTKSLSNILFMHRKFYSCNMDVGDDLLDHINKVKALADQLPCLEVPTREEDIVWIFYHRFGDDANEGVNDEVRDGAFDAEMSKRKKKEPQGKYLALVSRRTKGGEPPFQQGVKTCFHCSKPGHIVRFFYKAKNKEKGSANIVARTRTNLHLQQNSKRIQGAFANGPWIREPQTTWLRIRRHSTPTR